MDESTPASSAKLSVRLLAMLALVVAFAIVVFVITESLSDPGGDTSSRERGGAGKVDVVGRGGHGRPAGQGQASFYVVKPGDTLTSIADKTGLSVEELQRLNPSIDPQALISGQRIKLR